MEKDNQSGKGGTNKGFTPSPPPKKDGQNNGFTPSPPPQKPPPPPKGTKK